MLSEWCSAMPSRKGCGRRGPPCTSLGPGFVPDFTAAYQLRKALTKEKEHRRYLDVVLQEAAEDFAACQVYTDKVGAIRCRHCEAPVIGSVFAHLAYTCKKVAAGCKGIEATHHLEEQAVAERHLLLSKWLRGLVPLRLPEPTSMHYTNSASLIPLM